MPGEARPLQLGRRASGTAQAHLRLGAAGVILYGASPTGVAADIADTGLRPAMTPRTANCIAVQDLQPGDTVGYGSMFTADRAMRIGIVACGYADGYPRHAAGWGDRPAPVLVDGTRTTLVGRVSMDMVCVDLTPCPKARDRHIGHALGPGPADRRGGGGQRHRRL